MACKGRYHAVNFEFLIYYIGGIITYVVVVAGATLLFLLKCRPREGFILRFVLSLIGVLVLGAALSLLQYYVEVQFSNVIITNIAVFVIYLILFIVWVAALTLCYEEPLIRLVVAAVLGGLCQNIAFSLYSIINIAADFDAMLYISLGRWGYAIGQVLQAALAAVVLTAAYFLFAKKIIGMSFTGRDDLSMYVTLGLSKVILPILNALGNIFTSEDLAMRLFVRCTLMICNACILVLYVKMLQIRLVTNELEVMTKLNQSEHEHFLKLKQDMELVSIKCHDIKHFIAAAGARSGIDLSSLSEAVNIYDTTVKTGNDIIDTLIAERSLYCSAHSITLTVLADASELDFINATDMCALFGNILENAVEAAEKAEEGNRNINLNIRPVAGQIFVCVENTCSAEVKIKEGLPQTSKRGEAGYHGYGLKSIKMIAEKYGGVFSCNAEKGLFRVSILFPVRRETD